MVWLLFGGGAYAMAADLTPAQQKLWEQIKTKLEKHYAKNNLTPRPMSQAEIEAIRVPLIIGEEATGPLPWDMKLLLAFDRDLTLLAFRPGHDRQLFIMKDIKGQARPVIFTPDDLIDFLAFLGGSYGGFSSDADKMSASFIQKGRGTPTVLSLSQLGGGDELPGLWLIKTPGGHTPVVHFDYDDFPEFYVRNVSLLDYVACYIDDEYRPDLMKEEGFGGEYFYIDPAGARADFEAVRGQLEVLNDALAAAVMTE